MKNLQREDIHIISRHSNMTEQGIERALKENVYNDKETWQKFLRLFLITLGIGFTTAGIIFFFAYNWADLNKFVKLGLIEVLIVATTITVLLPKIKRGTKNIILTGSSFLVGALFAVFGQIYQTGADAYDFFLAWTLFITLWVIVSNFAPLWLLFIVLINTTFFLYTDQVVKDWPEILVITIPFLFNTAILIASVLLDHYKKIEHIPKWFTYILTLGSVTFATAGIVFGILDDQPPLFVAFVVSVVLVFALGIWHGIRSKNTFYLAIIPLSLIIIFSTLFFKISDELIMFLIVGLFIIASVTLVIINLLKLQKKWTNEK